MKKKLFRTVMAFFLAGAALTWVGCSDYDDDIQNINDRIDELTTGKLASIESQQASLQATLDGLRNADNALGSRIDELKSQSASAADLKKLEDAQAALKSTIEAVEGKIKNAATQDWVNATLSAYATTQEVGKVSAAIEALGKFTSEKSIQDALDAVQKAAVAAAGAAFNDSFEKSFEAAFAKAAAGYVNNADLQQKIDDALVAYDQKVADAIKAAVNNNGEVNSQIAEKLLAATEGIKQYLSARLTSVQLIPDLYEDGIETIELKSLAYYKWTVSNTEVLTHNTNGEPFTTSQAATQVRYHVSPSVVQKEDVEMPSLVFEKAETRAAVGQLLNVTGYDIAGGVLTVDVKKTAKTSLKVNAPYIYTAALKVPIASKHLTEGESDVAVYSDYVKVIETTVYPKIAALIDLNAKTEPKQGKYDCVATAHHHFSATYADAQAAEPSQVAAYNKQLDLSAMVTGCYLDKNGVAHEITKAALKDAGLEFRFAYPTHPYQIGVNDADQQKFINIGQNNGNWYAKSKLPDGTSDNQAAIDKTPIVRVELIDTQNNNAIVDVRYFKVQWLETMVPAIDLGVVKTFDYTLSCDDFIGVFNWEDMVREILAKLNGNLDAELDQKGMSYEEFRTTYHITTCEISTTDGHRLGRGVYRLATDPLAYIRANADVELAHNFDSENESTTAVVWRLHEDQIGSVIDKLMAGQQVKKNIKLTIEPNNRYHGDISFSFEVNIKLPVLPSIFGFNATFWEVTGQLANIFPVQYNTPGAPATCEYNYELDRLFVNSKVLKNMISCGKWDIQFSKSGQPTGYSVPVVNEPAVALGHGTMSGNTNGYLLQRGAMPAVHLNYIGMGNNWYGIAESPAHAGATNTSIAADINVTVDNNAAGIGVLGQNAKLKVWASVNCYNWFKVHEFDAHFVKPLKINEMDGTYFFEDFMISGSKIDWSKALTMTDFKNYIVAAVTTGTTEKEMYAQELYGYYDVRSVTWDTVNAKTNLKSDAQGNLVPDDSVNATNATIKVEQRFGVDALKVDGKYLRFKNVRGVPVEKEVKLFVPVTVEHKWGTESKILTVTVYPEGKTPAAPAE